MSPLPTNEDEMNKIFLNNRKSDECTPNFVSRVVGQNYFHLHINTYCTNSLEDQNPFCLKQFYDLRDVEI